MAIKVTSKEIIENWKAVWIQIKLETERVRVLDKEYLTKLKSLPKNEEVLQLLEKIIPEDTAELNVLVNFIAGRRVEIQKQKEE